MKKAFLIPAIVSLVLTLAFAGALSAEEQDAEAWIAKMRNAAIESPYRGTFMFSRGNMSSSMRVVHRYYEGQEQERLTQLDGAMGEILRRGTEVMCLINGQQLIQLDKEAFSNPVSATFRDFMPGHKYYSLQKTGYERIINRASVKLEIRAVDNVRYSYSLWLDKVSGLLLKSQVIGLDGRVLELFQFTELELPTEVSDEEFQFGIDQASVSHQTIPMSETDKRWPERLRWETTFTPAGFMRVEASDTNGNVMLYSDGLANYTVFVEFKSKDMLPKGASIVGASVIYLSPLEYEGRDYTVTVVGEIPPMTAMKVAKGVQPLMQ